jgi:uncharacterized protein
MEKLVQFRNSAGRWLRGMCHFPAGASSKRPAPGVVFFHGFTGDRMESHWIFIKCARELAAQGMASLRFDFFGSGESEGEFCEATLQSELADARVAVEFFRKQAGIDGKRLGLCGLSLGGAVAVCTARVARARALVLWSAVAYPSILRALASERARKISGGGGNVEYDAREVSAAFLEQAKQVEPLEFAVRFKGPTLVIHGGGDESVPVSHGEEFYAQSAGRPKELVVVAGADHTFTSLAWEREVIERTLGWFQTHLEK